MNILPFLFSFLIILTLSFNYASDRKQSTLLCSLASHRFFQSMHQSYSHSARTAYKRLPHKPQDPQGDQTGQEKDHEPRLRRSSTYFRKDKCCYEEQKLNLSKFTAPEISAQDFQYKAAVRLIKALYEHAPFYKEGLEYQVVNALLTRGDKEIIDLFKDSPSLDAIFYKMFKGTRTYEVGTDKGYPALLDYCLFTDSDDKLLYPELAKPVLEALVGPALMKTIEEKEIEKKDPLGEKELKAILTSHAMDPMEKDYLIKTLSFSKKKKGKQTACVDDNNEMILRR